MGFSVLEDSAEGVCNVDNVQVEKDGDDSVSAKLDDVIL